MAELGCIDTITHAVTLVDDQIKRSRTLIQQNRHEHRHKLARAVFHNRRANCSNGTAKDRNTNSGHSGWGSDIMTHWNTLCVNAALEQLETKGYPIGRCSLGHRHLCLSKATFSAGMLFLCQILITVDNCGVLPTLGGPGDSVEDVA